MKLLSIARYLSCITLSTALLFLNTAVAKGAGIKVIANIDPPPGLLNKQEIRNLFLGGTSNLDLRPIALKQNNETRVMFNTLVVGLSEVRIQSYWAQMRFSGRMKPPESMSTEQEVIDYVSRNKGVIAYVSSDTAVPEGLHVLLEISP
ncbi:MAG: hypothetical protein WA981_13970 [Glaciecola sp.]